LQDGRALILGFLDETKQKVARSNSGKKSETLSKNLALTGPGQMRKARRGIFRSSSQRRREKLKKSIALIGPVDPYAVEPTARTELNNGIELPPPLDDESTRQAEKWL
jgi:hypothetical protein